MLPRPATSLVEPPQRKPPAVAKTAATSGISSIIRSTSMVMRLVSSADAPAGSMTNTPTLPSSTWGRNSLPRSRTRKPVPTRASTATPSTAHRHRTTPGATRR